MTGRILATVLLLALAAAALTGGWTRAWSALGLDSLDAPAAAHLADMRDRAALAFLTARGLNAALSLAQSAQVGVFVSGQPGAVLEPVDDLVESLSDVMLVTFVAIGTQEVLLHVGDDLAFDLLLPLALAVTALGLWRPAGFRRWGLWLLMLTLFVRVLIPVATAAGRWVKDRYLGAETEAALERLARLETTLADLVDPEALLGALETMFAGDVGGRASQVVDDLVTLLSVFLFETVILPLLTAGLLYLLLRGCARALTASLRGRDGSE